MRVHRVTGNGALATTLAPGTDFKVFSIKLHLSAVGGSGNFTVTADAIGGGAYDVVYISKDMTSISDYVSLDIEVPFQCVAGDEIDFAWANANSRTYGLEVLWAPESLR